MGVTICYLPFFNLKGVKKMKIIHTTGFALIIVGFVLSTLLSVICIVTSPNSTSKYLMLFYMIGLNILLFLIFISEVIESNNKKYNEHIKTFSYFKDNSWHSYIYYTVFIAPLTIMIVVTVVFDTIHKTIQPETILQIIYWIVIALNFVWFLWHWYKANTLSKKKKVASMLKLVASITSFVGCLTDFIAKINFTKQFVAMIGTVSLMSYLIENESAKNK